MRTVPFAYATEAFPIVNYPKLVRDEIPVDRCPESTVFLDKPKTFWQLYSWYIIVALVIFCSDDHYRYPQYGIPTQKDGSFSERMPTWSSICRSPIRRPPCVTGADGRVADIEYHSGNEAFASLVRQNVLPGASYKLFAPEYISNMAETALRNRFPVTFSHYFKQTDTYYEFLMYLSERDREMDIFAIDITAKSKAANELREFAEKLDITLSVAHIIPWRWDLESHKIACEAQRILRHMNFTAQRGSTHLDSQACCSPPRTNRRNSSL